MAQAILDAAVVSAPVPRAAIFPAADETAAPVVEIGAEQRFEFTGSGSEYFRIWVVNLLLTILTLGIYSAWAKVRRLQYFHRNTILAGAIFDYHGSPKAILKGRLLALGLLAAYHVSSGISAVASVIALLLLALIFPWLLARAFRFKLANTSYRGLRFRFRGTAGEAYRMLILFPLVFAAVGVLLWSLVTSFGRAPGPGLVLLAIALPFLTIVGAVPLAHYLLKRYQHGNADFGRTPFHFHARSTDFFRIYGKAVGMVFLGGMAASVFALVTAGLLRWLLTSPFGAVFATLYTLLSAYVFYLFLRAYMESRLQNLVWNHTELGMHRFESRVRARKLLAIHASNLFLIALTLGLYKPFATVRLAKYRIENMVLVPGEDIEDFLATQDRDDAGAMGQEAGDLFDIDIGL